MSDEEKRRGHYLPRLPDGWGYPLIVIEGPDDAEARIAVNDDRPGYHVSYRLAGEESEEIDADTIDAAAKIAVAGVRQLERVRAQKMAYEDARRSALKDLGLTPKRDEADPEPG